VEGSDGDQYIKKQLLEKEHVKLDQTRTQANMLAALPLTTARE